MVSAGWVASSGVGKQGWIRWVVHEVGAGDGARTSKGTGGNTLGVERGGFSGWAQRT